MVRSTRIPARCNKRSCQARRNLSKRPEFYVRWPTCNVGGCGGKMYVDEYRLHKGPHDHAPLCKEDCLPFFHPVSSPGCKHREEYLLDQSLKPRSPHCPKPHVGPDDDPPF